VEECAPPSYPGYPTLVSLSADGRVSVPLGSPDPPHLVSLSPGGEPVTHFNLDQLLEIVQSFRLDTTHAQNKCYAQGYRKVGYCSCLHDVHV
jgi:hypothetical protein